MAKKAKKATAKASKRAAAKPASRSSGFKAIAMHITEENGRRTFAALKADRPSTFAFSHPASQPEVLDPESAAKRILAHAFASHAMPTLTAPKVDKAKTDFKSLGVETVPLTGTKIVKFRQQINGIPVFGSLVNVELDDRNEMVSVNSSVAEPNLGSYVARISPHDVLKRIAAAAGYGRELPTGTPKLNLYLDHKSKWHLAYIVEDVRSRKTGKASPIKDVPMVYDYVIDAMTGAVVAELPRTPAMAGNTDRARDELGNLQTFGVQAKGRKRAMRDPALNIETYDFGYRDPVKGGLPGELVVSPWSPAAVSAHIHAIAVANFLRDVLKRNNIDNMGGPVISTVNCVVKQFERPPGSNIWLNAFWDGKQMLYGQGQFDGKLRSMASSLGVVAHELFHGVTGETARLIYLDETGALNESYSDIFGTIISNSAEPDIAKWDWMIGDGISTGDEVRRDMQDPTRFGQPALMRDYKIFSRRQEADSGGVHFNSGIHNFAAFNVMSASDDNGFIFKPAELAAIFYVALTQQLSRQSTFSDSRRGVVLTTRSLFRHLPQHQIDARVTAVEAGFDEAGIK